MFASPNRAIGKHMLYPVSNQQTNLYKMITPRSFIMLSLIVLFLLPNYGLSVHQYPSSSEPDKTYESSVRQKKKIKQQPKKLTKRQKIGLYLLLPLFLVSFLLVLGIGVSGSDLILFAFLSLACLLAFIFSIIKGEDATIKVGNVLLVIATSINLLAYWWHRKIGGA